ncbi:MAG TPA: ABC transporter permease [Nakamurella sp.]|jgi:peptide/nickel transport system permease protein|nr:ABC transporter permease [Nakamurella sp.]
MTTNQGESLATQLPEPTGGPDFASEQRDFRAKEVEGLSQGQIVRRRFLHHRGAVVSLVALILILILASTSIGWGPIPHWWKWSYAATLVATPNQPPTLAVPWISGQGFTFAWGEFPFGADQLGYDNFSRVMRGIQQTIVVIVIMGILTTFIGTVLGAVAGYYRGWVESVIMRFTDLMITLPIILVTAVLGFVFGAHGVFIVGACLGLLSWTGLARLVRAEFLSLREREFVDAAKVAGASDRRIIFKHILPNAVGVIVVNMTLVMSGGILAEAALSFLGFGISFPDVSLGSLISNYQTAMLSGQPWLFIWPGVFIIVIVLCLNFLGDGLRDAFDPRQRRIPKAKDLRRPSGVLAVAEAATVEPVAEEDEPQ